GHDSRSCAPREQHHDHDLERCEVLHATPLCFASASIAFLSMSRLALAARLASAGSSVTQASRVAFASLTSLKFTTNSTAVDSAALAPTASPVAPIWRA